MGFCGSWAACITATGAKAELFTRREAGRWRAALCRGHQIPAPISSLSNQWACHTHLQERQGRPGWRRARGRRRHCRRPAGGRARGGCAERAQAAACVDAGERLAGKCSPVCVLWYARGLRQLMMVAMKCLLLCRKATRSSMSRSHTELSAATMLLRSPPCHPLLLCFLQLLGPSAGQASVEEAELFPRLRLLMDAVSERLETLLAQGGSPLLDTEALQQVPWSRRGRGGCWGLCVSVATVQARRVLGCPLYMSLFACPVFGVQRRSARTNTHYVLAGGV